MSKKSTGSAKVQPQLQWSDVPKKACLVTLGISGTLLRVDFDPNDTEEQFKQRLAQEMVDKKVIDPAQVELIEAIDVGRKSGYLQFEPSRSLVDVIRFCFEKSRCHIAGYFEPRCHIAGYFEPRCHIAGYFDHRNFRAPKQAIEEESVSGLFVRSVPNSSIQLKFFPCLKQSTNHLIDECLRVKMIDYAQAKAFKKANPSVINEVFAINFNGQRPSWSEFCEMTDLERRRGNTRICINGSVPLGSDCYVRHQLYEDNKSVESRFLDKIQAVNYKNDSIQDFYSTTNKVLDKIRFGQHTLLSGDALKLFAIRLLDDLEEVRNKNRGYENHPLFAEFEGLILSRVDEMLRVADKGLRRRAGFKLGRKLVAKNMLEKGVSPDVVRSCLTTYVGGLATEYLGPFYLDQVLVKVSVGGRLHTVSHRVGSSPAELVQDLVGQVLGASQEFVIEKSGFLDFYVNAVRQREEKKELGNVVIDLITMNELLPASFADPQSSTDVDTASNVAVTIASEESGSGDAAAVKTVSIFDESKLPQTKQSEAGMLLTQEIDVLMREYETRKQQGTEDIKIRFLRAVKSALQNERSLQEAESVCRQIDSIIIPNKNKVFFIGCEKFSEVEIKKALHGKNCSHIYKCFKRLCNQVAGSSCDLNPVNAGFK